VPPVALLTSEFCCQVQCKNLFDIEVFIINSDVFCEGCFIKEKKNSAARFIISDDIEDKIVVFSGNWRFPLSPFIK
jgi:hypothetical protein